MKVSMESTKDKILARVSDSNILNFYLKPYHNYEILRKGQLISNPFIYPNKQATPSFNIYESSYGWKYHDFATGENGDCFKLVMELYSIGFSDALGLIIKDLNLSIW